MHVITVGKSHHIIKGGKRYLLSKLLLSNEATMYVVLHGQRTCRRVIIPRTKGVSMSHVVEHWGVALTLTTILFSTHGKSEASFLRLSLLQFHTLPLQQNSKTINSPFAALNYFYPSLPRLSLTKETIREVFIAFQKEEFFLRLEEHPKNMQCIPTMSS